MQARVSRLKQAFDRDGFAVADRGIVKYEIIYSVIHQRRKPLRNQSEGMTWDEFVMH